ncbi:MAG TPA: 4-(cytidine 5'-diphospho)-2-C-methyl-D-erythritol kinase [Geminicoccaceae bacterium]|nr:4-(cytidine 5'-diphospho)-2-C-methyl-D-erythritol kinase [Geminicoccus sp.]HMU50321.1 4-(cytidine 5'-diphospho)-2-C-methyl-D-erythritol kinase [Geminicoccaceae bacterium]
MAETVVEGEARAKVNLDLLVTARRQDGYHELDSLVVFAGACDRLRAEASDALTLTVDGPLSAQVPAGDGNLVLAAARELAWAARVEPRAALTLTKRLPVAAGLGGGSADAAAALLALDRLWGTGMAPHRLRELALAIGADVPVCVWGRPARMRGIGERLDPVRGLPDLPLLLVNPGVPVPTGAVFKALDLPDDPEPRGPLPIHPSVVRLAAWLLESRNDLEPPAIRLVPEVGATLELLRGLPECLVARMSGSGGTCWALFADGGRLVRAEAALAKARPDWWRWAGVVEPGG